MTFEQILKDIYDRKFHNVYFLCGDEPYFIDKISDALQKTILIESEKEFNQSILYGLDVDVPTVVAAAKRFPMMSNHNMVLVKEAQHLGKIEDLEGYFSKPVDSTILILCYKGKKLDKRKSVTKTLLKNGLYFESKTLYENQIPEWITKQLSKSGYHISIRNAMMITEFLGNDLSHISNELSKIILNLPSGSTISGEEIEEFIGINKEYNTFEFNSAVGHRNILKANRMVKYFGQNEKKYPMPLITSNLYNHFSKVLKFHYVAGKSKDEQAAYIGAHPYFLKDYELAVKHYDKNKLVEIIDILKTYDLKSKGIENSGAGDGELLKEMVYKILH